MPCHHAVTGAGQAYRAGNKLVDVAKQADALVPVGGSAATRGTKVHGEFDTIVGSGGAGKHVSGESAYLNKSFDPRYRPKDSSNPDAVLGNIAQSSAVFDLKTGKSGVSNSQRAKYESNLPDGTQVFTVTPKGHDVPKPQSFSGMGAGFNTGYMFGDALAGSDLPYLGGVTGPSIPNPRTKK